MKTSRERRSSSGQSSSSIGGWATCRTKWTTTGPRHSATATRPLTRKRSGPRNAASTAIVCSKPGPAERLDEDQREALQPVRVLGPADLEAAPLRERLVEPK